MQHIGLTKYFQAVNKDKQRLKMNSMQPLVDTSLRQTSVAKMWLSCVREEHRGLLLDKMWMNT